MTSSPTRRRAVAALGALVTLAAVSVPTALGAIGTDADTTLTAPSVAAAPSVTERPDAWVEPVAAAAVAPESASAGDVITDPGAVDSEAIGIGPAIGEGIIRRISMSIDSAPEPAPAAAPPAPRAEPAADAAEGTDRESRRPGRDRRPARSADDDRIEIEVYGASIPEPPEVASSTTPETVLVEPDPSDPWRAVRECESRGNYATNTGNGFYGAYQFTIRTWDWVAGAIGRPDLVGVRPDRAAPADQDRMANALAFEVPGGGLGHWPVCGRLYGR